MWLSFSLNYLPVQFPPFFCLQPQIGPCQIRGARRSQKCHVIVTLKTNTTSEILRS